MMNRKKLEKNYQKIQKKQEKKQKKVSSENGETLYISKL